MSDTATDQTPTQPNADNEFVRQRLTNRDAVAKLGLKPYGVREDGLVTLASTHELYDAGADAAHQAAEAERKAKLKEDPNADVPPAQDNRTRVRVAGRVVLHRDNGKLVWLNLRDSTGDLQVAVSKRDCAEAGFNLAKHTDLADIIVAEGPLMKTRAGELTVWASYLRAGAKSIEPPPEKHAGLSDPEARFRRRYVDLWSNPEAMARLVLRGKIVRDVRAFMEERGFAEVETPVLQAQAGGAAAKPFVTHLNALDMDLSLRIAPELYLKRLLVAGMPRVFEMSRNFRNEGLSRRHNPEFTSMEAYQAFGDAHTMLELAESMVRRLAEMVCIDPAYKGLYPDATTKAMPWEGMEINYADPFVQVKYGDLFEQAVGCSMFDEAAVRTAAVDAGYDDAKTTDHWLLVDRLFEDKAEELIDTTRPTFVLHYPSATSPLTRPLDDHPELAGRWDLFIAGMEIGPAYTELNDPHVQEAKFRQQLEGAKSDDDTFRTLDEDFLRALRVGMPPAGGIGLGIDRLAMLLTGGASLREVIPFPFMRPEA
ncbi:MAG: lysine--tRNA ligase [Phycisphaera sp.]|nr:MAG: lysine--tRNA ligase [Phycisphaera sp.]